MATDTCTVAAGRFDSLPLPEALSIQAPFDAVVCVDAAYHARSLQALAAVAYSALRPAGRFAFTTLAINAELGPLPVGLSLALQAAGIARASLLPIADIDAALKREGFGQVSIDLLDEAVFAGFAAHVQGRAQMLSWRQRCAPGWLKIRGTALLCQALTKSRCLHYVLVHASAP